MALLGGDQHDLLDRFDLTVVIGLSPAVALDGRGRRYLDDQDRARDRRATGLERCAADDNIGLVEGVVAVGPADASLIADVAGIGSLALSSWLRFATITEWAGVGGAIATGRPPISS
jgi:hypothetical protein